MYYFDMTPLPIIILIVVILVILARCIRVVQQSKAYVIERLGAFHAVWSVGLHFKLPFIDRIQRVVSLKEQVADFPPQPVITKDNVTMQIDTVLYFQITDPKLYAYGVENPMTDIVNREDIYVDYHNIENICSYISEKTGEIVVAVADGDNRFAPYHIITE